jgi:hypothetical protein
MHILYQDKINYQLKQMPVKDKLLKIFGPGPVSNNL